MTNTTQVWPAKEDQYRRKIQTSSGWATHAIRRVGVMLEMLLPLPQGGGRRAGLEKSIRSAIRQGQLAEGAKLPSSRALAADLGISRSTVVSAYEQLTAEGFLVSQHGKGTRVAAVAIHRPSTESTNLWGATPTHDFRPGEPDTSMFPRRAYLRSIRRVLDQAPDEALSYPDPRGRIELRRSLVEYLGRTRSVIATPDAVQVFGGFAPALGFLARALRAQGHQRIAIEDGMLPHHRRILSLNGLELDEIGVDSEGILVDHLSNSQNRAVLVTPANQYPHGVTLTPARRAQLVSWAREVDGLIIEDDYDGEFRYDRRPIGALQALDPSRVIYAGTASKSLAAGLRVGWVVVPESFRHALLRSTHLQAGVSAIEQLGLADFIDRGLLDRQVRHMRRLYHQRQKAILTMLSQLAPRLAAAPSPAGLHIKVVFGGSSVAEDEVSLMAEAEARSIGIVGLHTYHQVRCGPPGIVLGFSRLPEHSFMPSLEHLSRLFQEHLV